MGLGSWLSPRRFKGLLPVLVLFACFLSTPALADVESSLANMRSALLGQVLPALSVIGLGIASISFFTGNPQAKQHILYAILGCCFGFGAQQISNFIASVVR